MHIEQERPGIFQVKLSGYELSALVSSARWIIDGSKGEFTKEAMTQLKQVVDNYDQAIAQLRESKTHLMDSSYGK